MALRLRAGDIIAMLREHDGGKSAGLLRSETLAREKPMKHRVRAVGQWLGISCLIFMGCTKLEDPNQWFGEAVAGNGGELSSGGNAGRGGNDSAHPGGLGGAEAGRGGSGGKAGGAGQSVPEGSAGEAGSASVGCEDETGFDGLGCYRCA